MMRFLGGCFPGFNQYGYYPYMMGGRIIMMLGTLLLVGIILYLIFRKNNGGICPHCHDSVSKDLKALDILKERYAKGEIDTEEYNKRKIELEK